MTTLQKKCGFCREIGHNISTCGELGKTKECSICLNNISKIKNSIITPCKHHFCFTCFIKWNHENNTCPLCRKRLTPRPREKIIYIETEIEVCVPSHIYYKKKITDFYFRNRKDIDSFCICFILIFFLVIVLDFVKVYNQIQTEKDEF